MPRSLRARTFGAPGVEGRLRGVFHRELHRLRMILARDLGADRERHVDAGGDAAAGEEVAIAHDAPGVRECAKEPQQLTKRPLTGRAPPLEEPGGAEQQ